ncbi:GNAT family N-acetyltransferase [Oryzobacter telluris]|uniref:GNAT family N-acetyltransferase n=1 Tax=Oryzobacter telluris TaxID=3149179 RepID=UPI00370D9099
MTPLDLATKPTLTGDLVVLRPFREGDLDAMVEILSDPDVRALTGSVETTAEAHQRQELDDRLRDWYATRNDQPDRLDLAIEDRATSRLVGEVVLNEVDTGARTANLRVLVGPDGRGKGIGTEAVGITTAYGLERLGLRRITLEVFDHNPRGRRVYEKVGYAATGQRADALHFDGIAIGATDMAVDAGSWRGWPPRDA